MRGAHSVRKHGKAKVVIAVLVILIALVAAGVAIYMQVSGRDVNSLFSGGQDVMSSSASSFITPDDEDAQDVIGEVVDGAPDDGSSAAVVEEPPSLEIYKNERFGFEVTVPQGFVVGSELPEGAGVTITNSTLRMTVTVSGSNNVDAATADTVMATLWNGSEDSIARAEGNRVIIYQYDDEYEYFYWVNVGSGSIDQMEIRYPLQDDNRDELDAAQQLMQGFIPGDLEVEH